MHGLLLLAYRLLSWPTIVTSRLPSSPAACFCPSGSRPFPLDFLLWGPFGHAATQVKFKPPRSKSASQNSSPPPRSPPPSPRFSAKKTLPKKRIVLTKNAHAKKQGFRCKKKHQKMHKKHVLNDRPDFVCTWHAFKLHLFACCTSYAGQACNRRAALLCVFFFVCIVCLCLMHVYAYCCAFGKVFAMHTKGMRNECTMFVCILYAVFYALCVPSICVSFAFSIHCLGQGQASVWFWL